MLESRLSPRFPQTQVETGQMNFRDFPTTYAKVKELCDNSKLSKLTKELSERYYQALDVIEDKAVSDKSKEIDNAFIELRKDIVSRARNAIIGNGTEKELPNVTIDQFSTDLHAIVDLSFDDVRSVADSLALLKTAAYEYLVFHTPSFAFKLLSSGAHTWEKLNELRGKYDTINRLLFPPVVVPDGFKKAELYFDADDTPVYVLPIIQKLYSMLCDALDIDEKEYPLRFVSVHSGSLFTELLGNGSVVSLVAFIIYRAFQSFHRTHTIDGSFDLAVDIAEKVIEVRNKLQTDGFKTVGMDKTTEKLGEELAQLGLDTVRNLNKFAADKQEVLAIPPEQKRLEYEFKIPKLLEGLKPDGEPPKAIEDTRNESNP